MREAVEARGLGEVCKRQWYVCLGSIKGAEMGGKMAESMEAEQVVVENAVERARELLEGFGVNVKRQE